MCIAYMRVCTCHHTTYVPTFILRVLSSQGFLESNTCWCLHTSVPDVSRVVARCWWQIQVCDSFPLIFSSDNSGVVSAILFVPHEQATWRFMHPAAVALLRRLVALQFPRCCAAATATPAAARAASAFKLTSWAAGRLAARCLDTQVAVLFGVLKDDDAVQLLSHLL